MRGSAVAVQQSAEGGTTRRALLAAALTLTLAGAGQAPSPATPVDVLTKVFTVQPARAEWFAPGFLAKISIDQVNGVLDGVRQQFGTFVRSTPEGRLYLVHLAKGDVRVMLRLDANGLINTLLIRPASAG